MIKLFKATVKYVSYGVAGVFLLIGVVIMTDSTQARENAEYRATIEAEVDSILEEGNKLTDEQKLVRACERDRLGLECGLRYLNFYDQYDPKVAAVLDYCEENPDSANCMFLKPVVMNGANNAGL